MSAWDRYWHDFAVERPRLVALRVAFFGLLAFDQWLVMLSHAPRYGVGGFNVTQIDWLDRFVPPPTAAIVTALWLVGGFLAMRAALGVAVRQSAIGLIACYAGVYFWCQADSYQHHYLVSLLLIIASFVPEHAWGGMDGGGAGAASDASAAPPVVKHWALRLFYVQIAFLYFWAAIAKADAVWLSGATIDRLTTSPEVRALLARAAGHLGIEPASIYPAAAWSVLLGELFAAAAFLWRRLWLPALLIVPLFHIGVEVLEFDIEWFSYYMLAFDAILLTPPRLLAALWRGARRLSAPLARGWARLAAPRATSADLTMLYAGAAALLAGLVAHEQPLEGAGLVAGGVAAATLMGQWPWPRPVTRPQLRAVIHVASAAALLIALRSSDVPYDYYRLWGGDLYRRGDTAEAVDRYRKANALAPPGPARELKLAQVLERLLG